MFHNENAPPSWYLQVIRCSWIFKCLKIKPFTFILNDKPKLVIQKFQFNVNYFFLVLFVAVNDGVTDTLCNRNHDIPIDIIIYLEFFTGIIDKTFNDRDVFDQRSDGYFN